MLTNDEIIESFNYNVLSDNNINQYFNNEMFKMDIKKDLDNIAKLEHTIELIKDKIINKLKRNYK